MTAGQIMYTQAQAVSEFKKELITSNLEMVQFHTFQHF